MQPVQSSLDSSTIPTIVALWEDATRAGRDTLVSGVTRFVERGDFGAAMTVTIGTVRIAVAPDSALAALKTLPVEQLHDAEAICEELSGTSNAKVIGTAELWYLDSLIDRPSEHVSRATETDAESMRVSVSLEEWDEAGIATMEHRWVLRGEDGLPLAIAGFDLWRDRIAQIGVITHGQHRRNGYAERIGCQVISFAVSMGLIAQWRSRVGNQASSKLARGLGFTLLGLQTTVALEEA